ncbi:glutamine--fructose-6-phosphate transaminase (isomerizing) [Methanobrevibacter curvatus]|uniref:Glutamine--fructose-6-phosphate aminotransferase [isomerizing] n=1 Tax=Methanobrevibacter curvatus TaxID=49547 RepID=A0A162FAA4_9EURY|nr:glutamine--fructose-6-phosphate transaminase (isomerizing) [Methanobrevibacter curvatus]KZX10175.1 glutamine--fructose-6-phosphate aminotransferase [Methanobrevibacter curvatus]
MCGIAGCISKKRRVAPILLDSVRKLEYRGYDSVGIATVEENRYNNNKEYNIGLKKAKGQISKVVDKEWEKFDGNVGITHVRWATHGIPSNENSHPHTDCHNKVAIVHNGIINNFKELKNKLIDEGHEFKSETDSEVITHIIESYMEKGMNLESALVETVGHLDGTYAIGAISTNNPDEIVAVGRKSPLVIGIGDGENYLASDVPAFLKHTKKIMYPAYDEIVILTADNVVVKDLNGNVIEKEIIETNWNEDMAEKAGYDHFMLKEIHEQAITVENTLSVKEEIENIVKDLKSIKRICFVACGTSYHAALTGKYLFENYAHIPTDVILASEFGYSFNSLDEETLTIFISQSGETRDTIDAIEMAKEKSKTLAIVNVLGSQATRIADYVIYTQAGPEIGVAATKTYIGQLICIYLLAAFFSKHHLKDEVFANTLLRKINLIPKLIEKILENEDEIKDLSLKYKYPPNFFYLGRGLAYPTALEGALKLKEITYIHAEGYAAGELKHGPLALIDYCVPVVVLLPKGDSYKETMNNLSEVQSRGGDIIAFTSDVEDLSDQKAQDVFEIPNDLGEEFEELFAPLTYIIPLQLLSYYISIYRGLDPDHPKNLAKCVTVG